MGNPRGQGPPIALRAGALPKKLDAQNEAQNKKLDAQNEELKALKTEVQRISGSLSIAPSCPFPSEPRAPLSTSPPNLGQPTSAKGRPGIAPGRGQVRL